MTCCNVVWRGEIIYRFIRTATVKQPATIYTALQFASEVCAHINKQHSLGLRFGVEMFSGPVIHWHFEADSTDNIYELFGKLGQDREYLALLDKYKDTWLEGSLKDRLVALMR